MPISVNELFDEDFQPQWLVKQKNEQKEVQDKFLLFVFTLRYGSVESCFKCGREKKFYLLSRRKCLACAWCAKQIFPLKGTALEKSTTPVKTWLAMAEILKDPQTSAMELKRLFKVTYKTAWRLKKIILEDFKSRGIIYAFIYENFNINDELLNHYKFEFVNNRQP